uniref:interleukin-12 receptor subunit beta-2 isoform X1 n=1 Tax=Jaculus jaculus TaxID=51337 RepID=UPI001E1B25BA|nr:interleukin-12 receptor subunit beta-2 isoform X1 [Jaculus jaculus]XP_045004599.1 interleukin-12 receptor subunit beta-2 isoform X1 [Jaculus jaculus]
MAHAVRECSLALTFLTMWLLIKAEIDVCKRGEVTVKPARVISLGSAVNISCSLKPNQGFWHCSRSNKLVLYKFNQTMYSHRGRSFTAQVTDLPLGTTLFVCKMACAHGDEITVCGVEISVGVVPEQPQNLSCVQKGEHGTVACTWDRGRDTHLYTEYTLQLTGPKNVSWQKRCSDHYCSHLDLEINLTPEIPGSQFTAKTIAKNSLGSSSSIPLTFTFLDIVRPLPPWDIKVNFLNASVSRCSIQWKDEQQVLLNRLRYRPHNSRSWNMVNATNVKGRHDLYDLKPFTEYEFQISSKLHLYKGSWSDWSKSLKTQTPEEKPTGMLDVWYMKQNIDDNRQQISLFWKNLSASEARGKILHYRVTLQEVTERKTALQNITRHTAWTWVTPRNGIWTAGVSAANSKGSSPPTRVNVVELCGTVLLAPSQVSASSKAVNTIVVTWQPPEHAASAVDEYVVEWRALWGPGGYLQQPLSWLRIPCYNMSALISEIKPNTCYEIYVHALSEGQAGCSSTQGNSHHTAPLSGPHINAITEENENLFISWNHIPVQEQMGCILHYRIYWKERDSTLKPLFREIPYGLYQNSYPINGLQPRVTYVLWMTALTAAGESPQGNEREFCLQGKANWKAFVASSISVAIITVGIFSVRHFRQKVFAVLSALRSQWCSREIPDPANSTWAKKYSLVEEKTQLSVERFLMTWTSPEEPEPLIISEVLYKVTPVFRHARCPSWLGREHGTQSHCTFKEEDTRHSASSPQSPSTLTAETSQLVDMYKVLGSRGPGTKARNPTSPMAVITVDYLPNREGYLPSNIDDLPLPESLSTNPSEDPQPQHISLSVFSPGFLCPLTSRDERLTLDQLKMGCNSLMMSGEP